jgi:hypothetical protein
VGITKAGILSSLIESLFLYPEFLLFFNVFWQ